MSGKKRKTVRKIHDNSYWVEDLGFVMTPETANKIIAEYMGGPYKGDSMYCSLDGETIIPDIEDQIKEHYLSLDALVPVWEKLSNRNTLSMVTGDDIRVYYSPQITNYRQIVQAETIQQAAAIATAKAIQELKQ